MTVYTLHLYWLAQPLQVINSDNPKNQWKPLVSSKLALIITEEQASPFGRLNLAGERSVSPQTAGAGFECVFCVLMSTIGLSLNSGCFP
jgi:hypothetical protein